MNLINNKNILIVDEDQTALNYLEENLLKNIQNITILKAIRYKECIKIVLNPDINIDIALINYQLSDIKDGLAVNFVLKKNIPTIAILNNDSQEIHNWILKSDIIDYISKTPKCDIKFITQTILRVLHNYDTHILLVDDSPTQLILAKQMLEHLKLNVTTALNGQEALDILNDPKNQDKFSLVLTDYNMPIMDGMELTKEIRKLYKKDQLGIIALSVSDKPTISTQFIKLGANDYLNKPYTQVELNTRINSNLEILELFKKTRDMANKDFLTGAFNRRYFFDSGEAIVLKAIRENKNVAVAMFDIDKFKNINDTYGHDIGDIAIKEVVSILNQNLRHSDLMARFGGEEFCVLLDNISKDDLITLFEKIRVSFENNILEVGDKKFGFTVSIGVYYGLNNNLEYMIKKADDGLYYCKNNGRNQVHLIEE